MSERQDFMPKADSGLERLLADFNPSPSMNYDDSLLPPDVFMQSPGVPALLYCVAWYMKPNLLLL